LTSQPKLYTLKLLLCEKCFPLDLILAGIRGSTFLFYQLEISPAILCENFAAFYDSFSLLITVLRKKTEEVALATRGSMTIHQRSFLKMLLTHLYQLEANVREIDAKICEVSAQFKHQLEQLDGIPGIDKVAAAVLAEIGDDMSHFKTSHHICSWSGLSPGNNESAGKKVYQNHQGKSLH